MPKTKPPVAGQHLMNHLELKTFFGKFSIVFTLFLLCFLHSSHNWNTLFLGTSAVADAIAQKYNTTKSQVLDHVSIWDLKIVSLVLERTTTGDTGFVFVFRSLMAVWL